MQNKPIFFWIKLGGFFLFALIIMVSAAAFVPQQFPVGAVVRVPRSASLSSVAESLARKNIIGSAFLFKAIVAVFHGQGKIVAGDYAFGEPQTLWKVADRITRGDQGLEPLKVTIPEGSTVEDIAWLVLRKIPEFNAPYFLKLAKKSEGYLFPDTYVFYQNTTAEEVFDALRKNFNRKMQDLVMDISLSRRKAEDVVIMASLLEKEAATVTDRGIISGILWKRLDEGMPLQVDATLVYITGDSYSSIEDTKIDSPYNTYKNKGLPAGPIANPGIAALRAAAQPVKTPYYYYLSDSKGEMHYASTFAGHQINREKYLRK